jgi:hypothetical protein
MTSVEPADKSAGQSRDKVSEPYTVRWGEPWPADLPLEHHQLVAEHRDLRVLRIRRRTQTGQPQQPPNKHEAQRAHHHDQGSCQPASPQVTALSRKWHPIGLHMRH